MLEDIKTILGITDNTKDDLINLYIRKAQTMVKNYLSINIIDFSIYQDAVIEIVLIIYNKKGSEGTNQVTQGNRNITFENNLMPNSVKALLPLPGIKMKG